MPFIINHGSCLKKPESAAVAAADQQQFCYSFSELTPSVGEHPEATIVRVGDGQLRMSVAAANPKQLDIKSTATKSSITK